MRWISGALVLILGACSTSTGDETLSVVKPIVVSDHGVFRSERVLVDEPVHRDVDPIVTTLRLDVPTLPVVANASISAETACTLLAHNPRYCGKERPNLYSCGVAVLPHGCLRAPVLSALGTKEVCCR